MKNLNERHSNFTRQLVLDTAVELLKTCDVSDLSFKKIAEKAGMSERTLYRHFTTRAVLMNALADKLLQQLNLPALPEEANKLATLPRQLYKKLEARPGIVQAILHHELAQYTFDNMTKAGWNKIKMLIDAAYAASDESSREIAAANISYFLSASTWHYFRYNFKLDITSTIQCAETGIEQSLKALNQSLNKQSELPAPVQKASKKESDRQEAPHEEQLSIWD